MVIVTFFHDSTFSNVILLQYGILLEALKRINNCYFGTNKTTAIEILNLLQKQLPIQSS